MTIDAWLRAALDDAERRGLQDLKPLLEMLAHATKRLREAELMEDPSGRPDGNEERPEGRPQ